MNILEFYFLCPHKLNLTYVGLGEPSYIPPQPLGAGKDQKSREDDSFEGDLLNGEIRL